MDCIKQPVMHLQHNTVAGWHVAGAKERQACYDHARGLQGGVEAQLGSVQLAAASGQLLTGAPLAAAYRWVIQGVLTRQ